MKKTHENQNGYFHKYNRNHFDDFGDLPPNVCEGQDISVTVHISDTDATEVPLMSTFVAHESKVYGHTMRTGHVKSITVYVEEYGEQIIVYRLMEPITHEIMQRVDELCGNTPGIHDRASFDLVDYRDWNTCGYMAIDAIERLYRAQFGICAPRVVNS